jgi:hypothetical protein
MGILELWTVYPAYKGARWKPAPQEERADAFASLTFIVILLAAPGVVEAQQQAERSGGWGFCGRARRSRGKKPATDNPPVEGTRAVPHRKAKELREKSRAIREESALTRAKSIPTMLRSARLKLAAKRLANAMWRGRKR